MQKVNCRSSTEAELIAMDYIIAKVLWTNLILEEQVYQVNKNIVLRDNQSTMKLEQNGSASSGKCTQHFSIKLLYITQFITDTIEKKEVVIKHCPTDDMMAGYMTKPLIGSKLTNSGNKS
jgi:hypothetical protein